MISYAFTAPWIIIKNTEYAYVKAQYHIGIVSQFWRLAKFRDMEHININW